MEKLKLDRPVYEEIQDRGFTKDGCRNALGTIRKSDAEHFMKELLRFCIQTGMAAETYHIRHGSRSEPRLTIYPVKDHLFTQLIQACSKPMIKEMGFFLEAPKINKNDQKAPIDNEERYVVWIYFTLHKKALTAFRKFFLDHIIEVA